MKEIMFSTVKNKATGEYVIVEHKYPIDYDVINAGNLIAHCENLNNKYGVGLKPASCFIVKGSKQYEVLLNAAIPHWQHTIN